ncbi:MAG: PH domain-containing protein [Elusimicrobiota bacterium]|nr:PH domain-containing protein [Elusimicrobiota bacterium]
MNSRKGNFFRNSRADKNLTIVRMMKPVVVPLSEITKAEAAVPGLLHGSVRLLGNDGLWGRYGKYSNAALGRYYLYVRSGKDQLLIEAANKYIIAPERPQECLESLQRAITAVKNTGGVQ